ncbi:MAG: hypothetical protein KKE86_06370 [Planctomycetes bacterium]|nr:hypothetical protein [Planctomycetota bacterium]MBU4398946.1 hypothetical protein [Planctomycetota bacterium]MCG2683737.1 hypothetical protein [Planctomycetales bacterium]
MLFINPMWDSENQRLGLKACKPVGYFLRGLADLIGFVGLILLVGMPIYVVYRSLAHSFSWHLCWFLLIPFGVGIIGQSLCWISWRLATKKQFHYDWETRTARWIEGGHEQVFPDAKQTKLSNIPNGKVLYESHDN